MDRLISDAGVMSSDVQEIEQAIQTLPREEVERLREWIENYLEDQLEVTEGFAARIERGKKDIEAGNIRVRELDEA
jgi:hypothetical protein